MRTTCKVCGKSLPAVAREHRDPYCTSTCAREAFGNPLPDQSIWARDHDGRRRKVASS